MSAAAVVAIAAFAFYSLVGPLPAHAQAPGKVYRVGWLASTSPPAMPEQRSLVEAFERGLRELGYVEGKNLVIERRYAEGKYERLPELAAELVGLKVDVLFASNTPSARAAQRATKDIPIVMAAVSDPVAAGLVASLARPGGNVTGLGLLYVELSSKRLELLREAVPGLSRVAVLWNPGNRSNELQTHEIKAAASVLGVTLQLLEIRAPEEIERAFHTLTRDRADALMVLDDPALFNQQRRIAGLAMKNGLATISGLPGFSGAGGLIGYGTHFDEHFRQAATFVHRILKGARPADLPVEQPTKFELVINLKTAKALGLTIPQTLLLRADRVIE